MSVRTGYLSDENIKKMCATHQQVPMNRPDLLPARAVNTSGIYMRQLKEMPVLQRPAKANYMLDSLEQITGKDISISYVEQLEKKIDRQPAKMLPRTFGDIDQQTYTNLSSVPNVADELYRRQLADVKLDASKVGLTDLELGEFGELQSLPSEVPVTILFGEQGEEAVAEPVEEEESEEEEVATPVAEPSTTAEMGTETRKLKEDYLIPFLKKNREERERTIRTLLRGYRVRGLKEPVTGIPTQPSLALTEQIFREFLDDIYEYNLEFDLEELLQIPTKEALGEPSGAVAGPSTLSGAETGLA